jgi:hypothetical protein
MWMSMTTVVLVWNQAALLHKKAQSEYLTRTYFNTSKRRVACCLT